MPYDPFTIFKDESLLQQCYCSLWQNTGVTTIDSETLLSLRTDIPDVKPVWSRDFYYDQNFGIVTRTATTHFTGPKDGNNYHCYGCFVYYDSGQDGLIVLGRRPFTTPYVVNDILPELEVRFSLFCIVAPRGN